MVAHNTDSHGRTPRSFSAETEEQLTRSLGALLRARRSEPDTALAAILQNAAREARERDLSPEELVLAFKRLESRLGEDVRGDDDLRLTLRIRIIRALLEAYYSR